MKGERKMGTNMSKILISLCFCVASILLATAYAGAHCEIPCGIYDDEARINRIAEHITTVEKSMRQTLQLQAEKPINYNQLVRWIMNKEDHATRIQHIVTQYFMTQRIKLDAQDYEKKLTVLHKILVYAMRCKQTTDLSNVEMLRSLLKEFHDLYFGHTHK
jgi:nickel superoxide dismutase